MFLCYDYIDLLILLANETNDRGIALAMLSECKL